MTREEFTGVHVPRTTDHRMQSTPDKMVDSYNSEYSDPPSRDVYKYFPPSSIAFS